MFTRDTLDGLVWQAGETFTWERVSGSHRLSSDARVGLAIWLSLEQDNTCPFCSDTLGVKPELCHIVSGGKDRKGFVPGNIAMGCRACNEIDAMNGPIIALETIKYPQVIKTQWPDMPYLSRLGKLAKQENEERKMEKRALRGM